jgi:acetyl esterase
MKIKIFIFTLFSIFIHSQVFSYNSVDAIVHVSQIFKTVDSTELKVDIFYKESSLHKANNSAIAFFHGGGWVCGNRSDFYATSERYASKGMIAFSFQYRLADQKKLTPIECLMDAKSAIRWIRINAKDYNIDVNKIIASGQSAGGHLAVCTEMIDMYEEPNEDHTISSKPNAIVVWSAPFNTTEDDWMEKILINRKSEILNIDPYHHIKSGLPPMLAFAGTEDRTVPYWIAEQFLYYTKKAGNHMELIRLEGKGHFFDETCKKHAGMFNDDIFTYVDEFLIRNTLMSNE